jgi:hypothetical protein
MSHTKKKKVVEMVVTFPDLDGSTDDVQDWIISRYGQLVADVFLGWRPDELLFATESSLKELAGMNIGARMFAALTSVKSTRVQGIYFIGIISL